MRQPITHLIDDDAAVRNSFKVLLEPLGIQVNTYASAEEFSRRAAPLPIDCLIIDINLPGASGIDLLDQLRMNGIVIPALFVTGGPVTEDVRSAAQRLRAVVYEKPMLPQQLITAVKDALVDSRASGVDPKPIFGPASRPRSLLI